MADVKLIDFIEQVTGGSHIRVEENLGCGFVRLRSEEAERRQAKHDIRQVEDIVTELLRNARDASASVVFLATMLQDDSRTIVCIDNGSGIPPHLHERVFEPRVTSKLESMTEDQWGIHGRGMALYSIKSNADSARVLTSAPGLGTAIAIFVDTGKLREKTDQSTFPAIEKDEEGRLVAAKGPHNILRVALEFALAHPKAPDIYLGSPATIAATLLAYGLKRINSNDLLFVDDPLTLPIEQRLAASSDAGDLVRLCTHLGLDISERTAHRILSDQISPVPSLYEMARAERQRTSALDLSRDSRGLKLAKEDIEEFSRELEQAFELLAQRYYLSLADMPKITVKGDAITVRFPIEKD